MTCSISISNESTDTSTALDDTRRSSSIPFQSRDKGCVTCAFFRGISCLVISGDDILGDQLCFYKIMVLLSVGLMELNLLSVCFLLCLCQENSVSNVGNLLLWDFFLISVASFSYSLGELDDNFEKEGDKEPLFFFIVNPCDTLSTVVNISLDEVPVVYLCKSLIVLLHEKSNKRIEDWLHSG